MDARKSDGVDNDCNGITDDVLPVTSWEGACLATGEKKCEGGFPGDTQSGTPLAPNDITCDGRMTIVTETDENLSTAEENPPAVKAPARPPESPCAPMANWRPSATRMAHRADSDCNGVDDDCDGETMNILTPYWQAAETPPVPGMGVPGCFLQLGLGVCDDGNLYQRRVPSMARNGVHP